MAQENSSDSWTAASSSPFGMIDSAFGLAIAIQRLLDVREIPKLPAVLASEAKALSAARQSLAVVVSNHSMLWASATGERELSLETTEPLMGGEDELKSIMRKRLGEDCLSAPIMVGDLVMGMAGAGGFFDPVLPDEIRRSLLECLARVAGVKLGQFNHAQSQEHDLKVLAERDMAVVGSEQLNLSTLAHDLRLPLMSISMGCEMLKRKIGADRPDMRDIVNEIDVAGNHMLRMSSNLLEMGRLGMGFGEVNCSMVPLREIVHEAVKMMRPLLNKKGIDVHILMPAGLSVWCDPLRLRQILINLLDNAVKFSNENEQIEVFAQKDDEESAGRVLIEVRDNGVGITPGLFEQIFCPYVRASKQHCELPGAGLGLAISREFARRMGGDITVASEENHGSTFTVILRSTPMEA